MNSPRALVNIVHGCATLGQKLDPRVLKGIEEQLLTQIDQTTSQDLTNLTWAYAKLGCNTRYVTPRSMVV
jgi:hypothetical protein